MFAVIRTGGKQYRVSPNDVIEIEKIAGNPSHGLRRYGGGRGGGTEAR